jgi:hypothetical protein
VIQIIREESGHRCEYIDPETMERCMQPAEGEPHHIRTRGAGGEDRRENLIQLCGVHHRMVHDGNLDRNLLIQIVADREGLEPEEVAERIRLAYRPPQPVQPLKPKLEDLVQAYLQIDEQEQETRFVKGQLLDAMLSAGATQKYLSQELGVSPSQIRELVHVYRTFPDPSSRIPTLSWYHHRVAARSSNPQKYLALAADQPVSIRQLREKILKDEGGQHLVDEDKRRGRQKAEKLFAEVQAVLAAGGEAAEWLAERLKEELEGRGDVDIGQRVTGGRSA